MNTQKNEEETNIKLVTITMRKVSSIQIMRHLHEQMRITTKKWIKRKENEHLNKCQQSDLVDLILS